jgi:hypothetical protein
LFFTSGIFVYLYNFLSIRIHILLQQILSFICRGILRLYKKGHVYQTFCNIRLGIFRKRPAGLWHRNNPNPSRSRLFCLIGLSLVIPFFSVLLSHPCYLCCVAAVKCLHVHLVNDVIYFRSLKIVQHDIIVVYTFYIAFLVSSIWHFFQLGWFMYFYLKII